MSTKPLNGKVKIKKKNKTGKPFAFTVSEPVFRTDVKVFVNMTLDDMISRMKLKFPDFNFKKTPNEDANGYFFVFYKNELNYPVIWVRKFNWSILEQSIFLHELSHFMFYEMRHKRIKNEEWFCYMLEYYMQECWRKLRKIY